MKSFPGRAIVVSAVSAGLFTAAIALAAPIEPMPGTAMVDGNISEWNLVADFFSNMHRAGRADKPLESKSYLRYDCRTSTMYALVLQEPGVPIVIIPGTAWIAINSQNDKLVIDSSGNDGMAPDFAFVDPGYDGDPTHARGYEASFPLATGNYNLIVHVDVFDAGATQTSATPGFPGTGPAITVGCEPVPVEASTWSAVKALYR